MVVGRPGELGEPAMLRAAEDHKHACAPAPTQFPPIVALRVWEIAP